MEKTPRFWAGKYWRGNNISNVLKEVVEPDSIDVSSIKINDALNPLIWGSDDEIKSGIRKILLINAKRFIEFCDIQNLKFKDIILTGSLANYNYNEHSDLDVHVVVDFDQISENKEFVGDFFRLKKLLWSTKLPIQVKGFEVEVYIQDSGEPHRSSGTYSLVKNSWIVKPTKKVISVDTVNIQLKASDIMNAVDDLGDNMNKSDFLEKHLLLKNKIKKFRQSGLDSNGEYSTENLVFKVLRNTGYLEKLSGLKNNYLTQELSMNEYIN